MAFRQCPSCGLKHTVRADRRCPRCSKPVFGKGKVVAASAFISVSTVVVLIKVGGAYVKLKENESTSVARARAEQRAAVEPSPEELQRAAERWAAAHPDPSPEAPLTKPRDAAFDTDASMAKLRSAFDQVQRTTPQERRRMCQAILPELERCEAHAKGMFLRDADDLKRMAVEFRHCSK
jgi:hypothetical protein